MKQEGSFRLYSTVAHFELRLALKDATIDIYISPLGDKMPHLRPYNSPRDAAKEKVSAVFFKDVDRIGCRGWCSGYSGLAV